MKRTSFKRSRKLFRKSSKSLKGKLWRIFSEYIRRRDADEDGLAICVTCGVTKHWRSMDPGHFIRQSKGLVSKFHEQNCHNQCRACNFSEQGNQHLHGLYIDRRYGPGTADRIRRETEETRKISGTEYEELILKYEGKLKELTRGGG